MENVSWGECQEFIQRLNQKSGETYRLPTEAEWEYAAAFGSAQAPGKKEKWAGTLSEGDLGDYAWYSANSGSKTHPVGTKKPNGLGLYDMTGNVWEWVQDWYGDYSAGAKTDPAGPPSGSTRVIRGGSWDYDSRYVRAAFRSFMSPDDRSFNLGFRLLRAGP